MTDIARVLAELDRTGDPVEVVRTQVLAEGGTWCDPNTASGIFEIQLLGLIGIGPSVSSAVEDWILQARARTREDVT